MTPQTLTTQFNTPPVPIVAIGAAEGGLEAVTELLQNLPATTGLAYVYVQPADSGVSPDLLAILGQSTTMPVVLAGQQMLVEPNQVYVIPPNQAMAVVDDVLTVLPQRRRSTPPMPVDQFFISVANRYAGGAIGVLLSGGVDDGVQGLKAIKAAGGFTFAQDSTALFQTMPASAIAEGVVDRVLSPAQIAAELERLSRQPEVFRQFVSVDEPDETAKEQSDENLKPLILFLRNKVDVDFTHYKVSTIRRRIYRRMLLFRIDTLADYTDYLKQNPTEVTALYGDLLINVTSFFRDAEPMDYLKKVLLPRLIKEKTIREPLRIWVPACSTGQEAYSLAMLLLEVLGERTTSNIQIFATDLSEQAIVKARLGTYSPAEVMDVSPRRLEQFFTKTDNYYRISKTVRDLCIFAPHNLFRDPPFSRIDLISCRNMLIYVDNVLQRKAFATFHYALNPMGYLLLGKSETVGTGSSLFVQTEKNVKLYSRKNDATSRATFGMNPRTTGDAGADPELYRTVGPDELIQGGSRAADQPGSKSMGSLEQTVDNLLLSRHVPASVVVNADLDILQSRGSTGLYLELAPGKASLNLLKMARPSLTFELRNAVHKVQRHGQPVRKAGLEIKLGDKTHMVAIEAELIDPISEEKLFLITFREISSEAFNKISTAKARNSRIRELEEELATVRGDMHSIVEEQEVSNEELQSANEEIVSSNEELQSINEELETNKEEIESTNEELRTINQELQVRNEQLSESYAFSEAIFATLREATLVIDPAGRILSANPAFYELFGLPGERVTGRLLYELADRQWDSPVLRQRLAEVLAGDAPIRGLNLTYSVAGGPEKFLSLNARRVMHQERQESILLAIDDITEQRRVQRMLEEREAWFHALVDNTPAMTWVANAEGHYTYLSRAWLAFTGLPFDAAIGKGWVTDIHPDDRKAYLATYKARLADRQPFTSEYRLRRHDGRYRWIQEQAHPMIALDKTFSGFIGTSVDIHLQKELNQELERTVEERTAELKTANMKGLVQQEILKNLTLLQQSEDLASMGSWEYDRATGQFTWSDGMYELFNRERNGQVTPEVYLAAAPDWDRLAGQRIVDFIHKGEGNFDDIVHIDTRDGVKTLRIKATVENNEFGIRVLGVDIDITNQIQALKLIERSASYLQAVLNNSLAAIGFLKAVFDTPDPMEGDPAVDRILDFRLVAVNEKFARLVGEPLTTVRGQSVGRLTDLLWDGNTFGTLLRIVEHNESIYEERLHNLDGESIWLALSAVRYDGGVVLTGLDITELKSMQEKQESLIDQVDKSEVTVEQLALLQKQVRERGELLRASSHDLRGNLGIIQGAAELFNIVDTDEERTQMQDMLQRNVSETTRLITELLDYSRLEAGQQQVTIGQFDAAELLQRLGENVRPLLERKKLHLYLLGEDSLLVEGDAVNVLRIAQNLVLNALKYTNQGSISLRWGSIGPDKWYFSVDDTGPGMDQNTANNLSHGQPASANTTGQASGTDTTEATTPEFVRVEKPLLGPTPGEGIGLVIVRQLCGLLQGRLAVESTSGKGSIFRVTLPRQYTEYQYPTPRIREWGTGTPYTALPDKGPGVG